MLVVAGDMDEFYEFIQKKSIISTVYSYVNSPSAFLGMSKDDLKGIFIGTWYDRPDILNIVTAINVIKGGIPLEVTDKLNTLTVDPNEVKDYK
jgi:hypothetical protein